MKGTPISFSILIVAPFVTAIILPWFCGWDEFLADVKFSTKFIVVFAVSVLLAIVFKDSDPPNVLDRAPWSILFILGLIGSFILRWILLLIADTKATRRYEEQRKQENARIEQERARIRIHYFDIYCDEAQMEELKKKAQNGDTDAMMLLSRAYFSVNDKAVGMHWVKKAAELGNEEAIRAIGESIAEVEASRRQSEYLANLQSQYYAQRQVEELEKINKRAKDAERRAEDRKFIHDMFKDL